MTAYQMSVNNAANYIAGRRQGIDAFTFSTVLAICFCKAKEDTLNDIILAGREIREAR